MGIVRRSRLPAAAAAAALALLCGGASARAQTIDDLRQLSIDQLSSIDVTSVSKQVQPLNDAPAAIYVITHEDIIRSGATSIPEMLRLAPNLQVAQTGSSSYVITARGLSGNQNDQAFSDKLLVLIDGRTVYSPLYQGVYWDMQDVPAEDIDRIEVISGPGATLWGANAVNGVINIITLKASQTQGGSLEIGGGDQQQMASLQYGGRLGDAVSYRLYAKGFVDDATVTAAGADAHDGWNKPQGGFRLDWAASSVDAVTLQGDAYQGDEAQAGAPDQSISGQNLLGHWNHSWSGGAALQVQAFYDRVERGSAQGGEFDLDTYDLDVQNSFSPMVNNELVWGGGLRFERYDIEGTPTFYFIPARRTLRPANAFVQDTVSITPTVKLTAGLKVEDDPYIGANAMPDLRLSWKPTDTTLLWSAVSRAIRAPTPFDRDVVELLGGKVFLTGNSQFQPEVLTAYEVGGRVQSASRLSFSISGYYNEYKDLRSIEPTPTLFVPLYWGNGMRGETYGLETWADFQAAPWWRLSASYDLLRERLGFAPGATGLLGASQAGDDPQNQATLKSSMDLGRSVTFDADLRYVDALPDPGVPAYFELNSHVAWKITRRVQLSLSGFNLLHPRHQEYPTPAAAVPRSLFADLRLLF